ncbi:MAG: hypothetical protein J6D02_03620 [Lachnospira sp.]|nr:hypothetical protein [Lachnospira sp.]
MLDKLCNLIGVSGYESEVNQYLYKKLEQERVDELSIDSVGNLICLKRGKENRKKVVIVAHVDEVGFQVIKRLEKEKYLIKSLGNIKTWNAYQQRVESLKSYGVIRAYEEEKLKAYNYNNLYLEVLNGEDNIKIGEVFSFKKSFYESENYYVGKALDNRISCFCLYQLIKLDIPTKSDIYYCFTVQEEIGMRGSRVIKSNIQPDLSITIDVSAVGEMNSIKMSLGAGLKISDSMSISHPKCIEWAQHIAMDNSIQYQLEVSDCGTSELIISNELDNGGYELGISIPCRGIHSANSVVNKSDLENTQKLMEFLLMNL